MTLLRWLALTLLCACNTFSSLEQVSGTEDMGLQIDAQTAEDVGPQDATEDADGADAEADATPDLASTPEPYEWQGSGRKVSVFSELPRFDVGGRSVDKTAKARQQLIFAQNHAQLVYFRQEDITSLSFARVGGTYELATGFAFRPPRELSVLQLTDFDTRVDEGRVFRSFTGHDCDVNNDNLDVYAWAAEAADVAPSQIVDPGVPCGMFTRYGFATEFVGGWNPVTEQATFPIHYAWFYGSAVEIRPEGFALDDSRVIEGTFVGDFARENHIFGNRGPVLFGIRKSTGLLRYAHVAEDSNFADLGITTLSERMSSLFVDGDPTQGTYILAYLDSTSDLRLRRVTCSNRCLDAEVLDRDGNEVRVPENGSEVRMLPVRGGFVLLGYLANQIWWRVYAFGRDFSVNEIPTLGSGGRIEVEGDVVDISGVVVSDGNGGADLLIGHRVTSGDTDHIFLRGFRTPMFFGKL